METIPASAIAAALARRTAGLRLKKAGNEIMALLGGREIHPINVRVGGFYKLPAKRELLGLAEALKRARDEALETVRWTATLDFTDFEQDYVFVALRHANEYPFQRRPDCFQPRLGHRRE